MTPHPGQEPQEGMPNGWDVLPPPGAGLHWQYDEEGDTRALCEACRGSGTCADCDGWGDGVNAVCDSCDDTGTCRECQGLGEDLSGDEL